MIITKRANDKLFQIVSNNVGRKISYGPPPVFYWYRKVIEETKCIEQLSRIRRGNNIYRLPYRLGFVYFTCEYVKRNRIIIITDFYFNLRAINTWYLNRGHAAGIIKVNPPQKPKKPYRLLSSKKPLFGYRFVMNDKKEYNLINDDGKLITKWFRMIKPFKKPYGKYQIIAYINVGGFAHALAYDGKVYGLNRTWKAMYTERRINAINLSRLNEQNTNTHLVESMFKKYLEKLIKEEIMKL